MSTPEQPQPGEAREALEAVKELSERLWQGGRSTYIDGFRLKEDYLPALARAVEERDALLANPKLVDDAGYYRPLAKRYGEVCARLRVSEEKREGWACGFGKLQGDLDAVALAASGEHGRFCAFRREGAACNCGFINDEAHPSVQAVHALRASLAAWQKECNAKATAFADWKHAHRAKLKDCEERCHAAEARVEEQKLELINRHDIIVEHEEREFEYQHEAAALTARVAELEGAARSVHAVREYHMLADGRRCPLCVALFPPRAALAGRGEERKGQ